MKTQIIALLILVSLFITGLQRRHIVNKLLKQLYRLAYVEHDSQAFQELVDSPKARLVLSVFTRYFLKLRYFIDKDLVISVDETYETIRYLRMNANDLLAVNQIMFGYCLEHQRFKEAEDILNKLRRMLSKQHEMAKIMLLFDCELTYDIYVNKNTQRIPDLKELLAKAEDDETKAVYLYRLAMLYAVAPETGDCRAALNQALQLTKQPASQQRLRRLLDNNNEGW